MTRGDAETYALFGHEKGTKTRRLLPVLGGLVVLLSPLAQAEIPNGRWGIEIHLTYPFAGSSVCWFTANGIGFKVNILPDPSSRHVDSHETSNGPGSAEETRDIRRLDLSLSAKFLYPVRNDENVTDYFRAVRPSPSP